MLQAYDNFIISAIENLPRCPEDILTLKKKLSKQFSLPIPTNADMRQRYEKMIEEKIIQRNVGFEKTLMTRGVRTASGVAVVAVLTRPSDCPGKCLYCPTEKDMPKSYLSNEPAVMRAIANKFNPYRQVQSRLKALELNGHSTDKIELIVMGGTFSHFPKTYQKKFITECFRAANEYSVGKNNELRIKNQEKDTPNNKLFKEQKRNEKTKHRIIGLTLETRPDYIDEKEIANFRLLGCTRVELGVQSIFDDVLELNKRGHTISETIRATKLLKDAGFKINYHIMPGLLGSTIKRDIEMFRQLFTNQDFQPDMLKIYPTVVIKDSELYAVWKKGNYKPLTDKHFEKLIIEIKNKIIPPYVRIARLVRDVPTPSIEAGPIISNMRQIVAKKAACRCIRCREVRADYDIKENIILDRIDYGASDGKEIFLQFVSEDKNKLFALLRLRLPYNNLEIETTKETNRLYKLLPALENSAIIREVHTYGKLAQINQHDKSSPQHIGLGKKLIQEAEKIARKEFGAKKIAIISGIGVRGYYRKQNYRLQNTYMVKNLK
ncbi:MAG: Histone acetyltransferase, ELP3 family [Candidatus Moranbacteria bacterium GW2011_GWE2_35_2-]|nr:MAG: Histone acetyltransferase, ELP3 family [Candidatus Moranbacteria bacterium GW2011_GWE2_35_2-]KKQ22265.1 MAG: Histone acetyltransferase, ELP3 family [Candidatus Moranbacteria bacterium GW2011_GWF2_37_11]KKQ28576.1 MAG: Histone acetyltransferase, ELP3 family [Candidatus Moranbacteria bacterium GW2011_GWD1_37_17]KKQ30243.1 MAG: Histone acetyltransferase, ELP3 family [Candidatus Moranbacteria bacterium GW2011_GWE1_37_24]KKQ47177.1 MAG: Histone acetyltransferase, ELP3 family [Candidatus Mora